MSQEARKHESLFANILNCGNRILISNIPNPLLTGDLKLIILTERHAKIVCDYYIRNLDSFKEWEPLRSDNFYTPKHHYAALKQSIKKAETGSEYRFQLISNDDIKMQKVIGMLSFSSIVKGSFLSCFTGYSMDRSIQNNGLMTQALREGIKFIFETVRLHRIEANIMPKNLPSLKVAAKLGFENEGLSPNYLKINGKWEDHIHMVLRNKELE